MASGGNKSDGTRLDDYRPGRLPHIVSTRGNLIWRCRVYAQPADVRLVLRASADGHVWASIGKGDIAENPPRLRPEMPSPKRRDDLLKP